MLNCHRRKYTKDREISELKEQMSKMQQDFESYNQMVDGALEEIKHEIAQKVWRSVERGR